MNKTHVIRRLPCGCDEAVWVFGREVVRAAAGCDKHGPWAKSDKRRVYSWTNAVADPSPQEQK